VQEQDFQIDYKNQQVSRDFERELKDLEIQSAPVYSRARVQVWRGAWNGMGGGIEVAVKKLVYKNRSKFSEFIDDINEKCKLHHPNVLTMYGWCSTSEEIFIISEFCEIGTLHDFIRNNSHQLNLMDRLKLIKQAIRGVNFIHSSFKEIIHKDIKSTNFLVTRDRVLKLQFADANQSYLTTFTNPGYNSIQAFLPLRFRAPETIGEQQEWSKASDIFALGCTILEILTSKIPYEYHKNIMQVILSIKTGRKPYDGDLLNCPIDFKLLLDGCWNNNPKQRPQSIHLLNQISQSIEERHNTLTL